MTGTNRFTYESDATSVVAPCSRLFLDNTMFKYAPNTQGRDLFMLFDKTSELYLDGSTLESTTTGLRLTTGTLIAENKNFLVNDGAVGLSEGFAFGNQEADGDLSIIIKPGATLQLLSGVLDYQNIDTP